MANYKRNALTKGASGSFGDEFVFRQVDGKTIIAQTPSEPESVSKFQIAARKRFLEATYYAKSVMAHPGMQQEYAAIAKLKKFRGGAMVAAVTDYLKSGKLVAAYAHQFDSNVGFPVTIVLADNYKAKEMKVTISNKDGTIIENGNASFEFGKTAWVYTTTRQYQGIDNLMVSVTIKDRIGRLETFEQAINSLGSGSVIVPLTA